MKSYYRVFNTNLPIPMRISLNVTNADGEIHSLHTSKEMRTGVSNAKYGFPSKLNYFEILYCFKGEFTYVTDMGEFEIKEGECLRKYVKKNLPPPQKMELTLNMH